MKKAIALAVAVAMAAAVGCGATETAKGSEAERIKQTSKSGTAGSSVYVLVDEETGVEYLLVKNAYGSGITAMVNPDGTPKIAEGYETEVVE